MTLKRKTNKREKTTSENNYYQKSPFYFYIILFSIPILFFIILELSLQIFNYGYDLRMWITVSEGKLMLNPEVARRYFTNIKL